MVMIQEIVNSKYLNPNSTVSWGGGEVTLYPAFASVAEYLMTHGFHQFINTNAILYSPLISSGISSGNIDLQVSVDSGSRSVYERIKGGDYFDTVWANLSRYAQVGRVTVKYILIDDNSAESEIERFLGLCIQTGIKRTLVVPENRQFSKNIISDSILSAAATFIDKAHKYGLSVNEGAEQFGEQNARAIRQKVLKQKKGIDRLIYRCEIMARHLKSKLQQRLGPERIQAIMAMARKRKNLIKYFRE